MVGMTTCDKNGVGVSPRFGGDASTQKMAEVATPLTKTIRELRVGETAKFPIERHGSVKAIVSRMRMEQIRIGWSASISVDYDNYQVEVRRTR